MARNPDHRIKKRRIGLLVALALILLLTGTFLVMTRVEPPEIFDRSADSLKVDSVSPGFWRIGHNWLQKNKSGLWVMYLEGGAYERGVINGKLTRRLLEVQEKAFISQIREMIPSDFYLRFLKYFIYWFNRDLDSYVPKEYKEEIYGISQSASPEFSFIGPAYQRMLNYHSAHDIGHALQDYNLVGCTSFGVWGSRSVDSSLIIGRNFDFHAGEDFSRNKIVMFVKPDSGFRFMMVTWAGMIGTVSGMNEKGLTVTINAARSEVPVSARTPISILAREILQYAGTIDEAYRIAEKHKTFVSESILIGSANDGFAAIIEKSPSAIALLKPGSDHIVCANHFQSERFAKDPANLRDQREGASVYRQRRLLQDLTEFNVLDAPLAARILRDRSGLNGADIGMGNEKAMNQLIAHHSVIFMPARGLAWVSAGPWQCGSYVCFNLYDIFHNFASLQRNEDVTVAGQAISADPFLESNDYQAFLRFQVLRKQGRKALHEGTVSRLNGDFIPELVRSNPGFFETWELAGDLYAASDQHRQAAEAYRNALRLEVPKWGEKTKIIKKLVDEIQTDIP